MLLQFPLFQIYHVLYLTLYHKDVRAADKFYAREILKETFRVAVQEINEMASYRCCMVDRFPELCAFECFLIVLR